MAAVLELVFDIFDRLPRGRIKVSSIRFQKEELIINHYFVSSLRQNVSACLLSHKFSAVFDAGSMADRAPLAYLVFLLYGY